MSLSKSEINLRHLLTNADGFNALCDYLDEVCAATDAAYTDVARKSVFSSDARDGALIMYGRYLALSELTQKLKGLAKTKGKSEGK